MSNAKWPFYHASAGQSSFQTWKCPNCGQIKGMGDARCLCGFHRPCDICEVRPAHLYPEGVRCDAHVTGSEYLP